ncbi:MAG TPA: hypothetical protein VD815_07180 [Candidatus Saccharimonadales bacterium]|nr:hypothetical protein [Candidatus Saccharimonadales bacterium]
MDSNPTSRAFLGYLYDKIECDRRGLNDTNTISLFPQWCCLHSKPCGSDSKSPLP